ncbi:E3 SUMO-protein ligase NSE2-like [Chelonus insularis]|uniref:E3 SUMO-protein ligase NSE2-like n=1 Tax=Chelonus insularis TaxID=460826 RepID=UPI00158AA4B7|nr:E3 SUMO-protein ligase NSE2-like [Chelonus insularis]
MTEFEKSLQSVCDNMIKSASYAINYLEENKRQKVLDTFKECLEDYVKSTETLKHINTLMNQSIDQDGESDQQQLLEEFNQQTSSFVPDISDNEYIRDYDECVEKLVKIMTGVNVNNTDTEMEITDEGLNSYANLICPISKAKMTHPMKNTICGHIYDKASIDAVLRNSNATRCPIVGCRNKEFLNKSYLKPDLVAQICIEACANRSD